MPCRMSHASIPAAIRAARSLPEDLIRLCVGIEDVEDLWEDLVESLINADLVSKTQVSEMKSLWSRRGDSGIVDEGDIEGLSHVFRAL